MPVSKKSVIKSCTCTNIVTDEFEEKFFIQNLGGKHSYDIWQVVKHFRNKNNGSSSPHWADYRPGSSGLNSNSDATHCNALIASSIVLTLRHRQWWPCSQGWGIEFSVALPCLAVKMIKNDKSMSGSKTDFPFFNRSQIWSTSLYSQNIPFYRSPGTCMSIQINPRVLRFEV